MLGRRRCNLDLGRFAPVRFFLTCWVALWLGCGSPSADPPGPVEISLSLVSPAAPLGLSYGEQATLVFRYTVRAQPQAGVALKLRIDATTGGGTLSTPTAVTNDLGEASVRLTAGTTESAFHVTASAPQAQDAVVDVAVSRFAFGTLHLTLDGARVSLEAVTLRAGLYPNGVCAELPPTPMLTGALRSQKQIGPKTDFLFGTLLLAPYAVVGRGETQTGRLIAQGCVEIPETVLRTDLNIPLEVPLAPVWPSPVGRYLLETEITPTWPGPDGQPWHTLTCSQGLGQTLIDAVLVALPAGDLSVRLAGARSAPDAAGCRPGAGGTADPDPLLQSLLAATVSGPSLSGAAADFWPVLAQQTLRSSLAVRGSTQTGYVADHVLETLVLKTRTQVVEVPLSGGPQPAATDLSAPFVKGTLALAEHGFAVRVPGRWQKVLADTIWNPKGYTKPPGPLFAATVDEAAYGPATGCAAVEDALCDKFASPCKGPVLAACKTATARVSALLDAVLVDRKTGPDLRLGFSFLAADETGTLQVQSLKAPAIAGALFWETGQVPLAGKSQGPRQK